jgi:hypothetical protein
VEIIWHVARLIFVIVLVSCKGCVKNTVERTEGDKFTKGIEEKKKGGKG